MLLNIKGIDINYEIYGEGEETLLILHGWMGSIPAMAPIWKYFMNNRKVVVLDFPGQGGKSGKLVEPWGVPEYSEMVRSFMEELKLDKPDVIFASVYREFKDVNTFMSEIESMLKK